MESKQMIIDDMSIYYEIHGSGRIVLLLIHGAVGSSNDFQIQIGKNSEIEGLNKNEFTIVTLDLPGHGRSELKHPDIKCEPTIEYFKLCADVCANLMTNLGHKTYSVGGWSDGSRVAALLAIKCQSRINTLLLWGFVPVMDELSCQALARSRDTSIWDPKVLETYTSIYGEAKFSELWRQYVDFIIATLELPDQFDIRDQLSQIKCPTLIMHGSEDPIVNFGAHVKPIDMRIYDLETIKVKGAAHNIHQARPEAFNKIMTRFVTAYVAA